MRAIIEHGERGWRSTIGGNMPDDPTVAAKFKETGFFNGFAMPPGPLPEPKGLMLQKSDTRVYSNVAAELVRFAGVHTNLSPEVKDASYENIVEAMSNTRKHANASDVAEPEKWFAGVYCEDGFAYFTFVDIGIGIVKSATSVSYLRNVGVRLGLYGQGRLLADAFNGVLGSSTGEAGRGKGLPKMKRQAAAGELPGLHVVTNRVVGSVSDLRFEQIDEPLSGTLLAWRGSKAEEENAAH